MVDTNASRVDHDNIAVVECPDDVSNEVSVVCLFRPDFGKSSLQWCNGVADCSLCLFFYLNKFLVDVLFQIQIKFTNVSIDFLNNLKFVAEVVATICGFPIFRIEINNTVVIEILTTF